MEVMDEVRDELSFANHYKVILASDDDKVAVPVLVVCTGRNFRRFPIAWIAMDVSPKIGHTPAAPCPLSFPPTKSA